MSFKQFTLLFVSLMIVLPVLVGLIGGFNESVKIWLLGATILYLVACGAEWLSNRRKK